jgi:hypothetical protein
MLQRELIMVTSENKLKKNPCLQIIPGQLYKNCFQKFPQGSHEKLSCLLRCNKNRWSLLYSYCIAPKKKHIACVSKIREKKRTPEMECDTFLMV